MKSDIQFMAKQALGRVQKGEFSNLSSAVRGLRKEAGLNDEQTHRLVEAVNREAHSHNFSESSPNYVTFDIARPEEVFPEEKTASQIHINRIRPTSNTEEYIPGSEFFNPSDIFGKSEPTTKVAGRRLPVERPAQVREKAEEILKLAREEMIVARMNLCDSLETFLKEAVNALHDNTLEDVATSIAHTGPSELVKEAFSKVPKLAESRDIEVRRGHRRYIGAPSDRHPLMRACEGLKMAECRSAGAMEQLRGATIAHDAMKKYARGEVTKEAALKEILEKAGGVVGSLAGKPLLYSLHGLSTLPFITGKKQEYIEKGPVSVPAPSYGHTLRKTGEEEKEAGVLGRAAKIGLPLLGVGMALSPQGQKFLSSTAKDVAASPMAHRFQEKVDPAIQRAGDVLLEQEQRINRAGGLPKLGEEKDASLRLSIGGGSRKPPTVKGLAGNAAKWGLALGLASVIGGAGGSAISSALESGDKAINLGGAINRAVEHDPDLKKIPKQKLVTGASTLWDLNKDFAKQPMIMASWLKRVEQMPDSALAMAPQMIGAREKMLKARSHKGTISGGLRSLAGGSSDVLDL